MFITLGLMQAEKYSTELRRPLSRLSIKAGPLMALLVSVADDRECGKKAPGSHSAMTPSRRILRTRSA